jgi:hypothetical protein
MLRSRISHRRSAALALAVALGLGGAHAALADGTLTNASGSFIAGINSDGSLYTNTSGVGIQRTADDFDPLAPGTPRDSFGVAAGGVSGYADEFDFGVSNLVANSPLTFGAGNTTASDSFFLNNGSGNILEVTESYSFVGPQSNIVDVHTTLTNVSGSATDVMYSHDVDWDVAPTEDFEITSASPGAFPSPITDGSSYGFENPDPTIPFISSTSGTTGPFGPGDLGGGFKADFGSVANGASVSFDVLEGISDSTQTNADLTAEVQALGATYSLTTYNSDNSGPPAGINSAVLAFVPGATLPAGGGGGSSTPLPVGAYTIPFAAVCAGLFVRRMKKQLV